MSAGQLEGKVETFDQNNKTFQMEFITVIYYNHGMYEFWYPEFLLVTYDTNAVVATV